MDISPIAQFLNQQIADGNLPSVSSGANQLLLPVPGREQPLAVSLTIPTIELDLPVVYVKMRLRDLRFRHVSLWFDGVRQALRLRIYFHNQRQGIVGYYKVGPIKKSLKLHTKRVRLDVYIKPRLRRDKLAFEPLEVALDFYQGNIPGIVRPVLLKKIEAAVEESRRDLQLQLEDHLPELTAIVEQHAYPMERVDAIRIENGAIAFVSPSQ